METTLVSELVEVSLLPKLVCPNCSKEINYFVVFESKIETKIYRYNICTQRYDTVQTINSDIIDRYGLPRCPHCSKLVPANYFEDELYYKPKARPQRNKRNAS